MRTTLRGAAYDNSHPLRYCLRTYCSASEQLVTRQFGPSHSSCLPVRIATLPSKMNSVSSPAISKFENGAGPPLIAAIHSSFMPGSPRPLRGNVGDGGL